MFAVKNFNFNLPIVKSGLLYIAYVCCINYRIIVPHCETLILEQKYFCNVI